MHETGTIQLDASRQSRDIARLGPWFHNPHLPGGVQTAPDHWLGDFPRRKWRDLAPHLPADLTGWSVLDVGCNAGFYSFELARRGARVTAIDADEHYLAQARWAAGQLQLESSIDFHRMQVYEIGRLQWQFDLVVFMGVFYHLRYPLLALDALARATKRLLVFQSLTLDEDDPPAPARDYTLEERAALSAPGWPRMAFVEGRIQSDPTNWWVPNAPCVEALLRSAALKVITRLTRETYLCEPAAESSSEAAGLDEEQFRAALGIAQ